MDCCVQVRVREDLSKDNLRADFNDTSDPHNPNIPDNTSPPPPRHFLKLNHSPSLSRPFPFFVLTHLWWGIWL